MFIFIHLEDGICNGKYVFQNLVVFCIFYLMKLRWSNIHFRFYTYGWL